MSLSGSGQKVFNARLAMRDDDGNIIETFEQAVSRLASAAASAEPVEQRAHWERKFSRIIGELLFIPSTPIWANVGKPDRPWQPSACFVLAVEDNLASMYQTLASTAMVFKSGGGVGYNFSNIRPRGDIVRSTKGQASGVVELIKLYNTSSDMVMQGGIRRGASMGILNIDHPEIIEFINAKLDGTLANFNLSVGVTDAFMAALAADADWELKFSGRVYKTVKARYLWDLIAKCAWVCGDPGIIFLDTINKDNPMPTRRIDATNPCVTGDTWVITDEGPRHVVELIGRQFKAVVNGTVRLSGAEGFFETGTKPVVRLSTREGYALRLTADHKVLRATEKARYPGHTEWVAASELKHGDQICIHNHRQLNGWPGLLTEGEGYLLGLLVGDGTLSAEAAILRAYTNGNISAEEYGIKTVMDQAVEFAKSLPHRAVFKGWYTNKGRNVFRLKLASIKNIAFSLGMTPGNKTITPAIERTSSDCYRGFLRGLFDTDGTVVSTQEKGVSVRLSQSNIELLRAVQRMLLRLGIASVVYSERRPEGFRLLPDSNRNPRLYSCKATHELMISKDNLQLFANRIGFVNSLKATKLASLLGSYKRALNRERFVATVLSVDDDGSEPVYDVQIPGVNAFDANGIYVHNCGEQPLSPGESCLLGSINLAHPRNRNGSLNEPIFRHTVYTAIRFLDNLIDIAEYPLAEITAATQATRKIGLGFTGLADALIMAGLPYDSAEGREYAGEITLLLRQVADESTASLAEAKGCFPDWLDSTFRFSEKRRNASCITIAPTGSVTTIADCEGYGVEPIFAVAYKKTTNIAGDFHVFSPLFLEHCRRHDVLESVLAEVAQRGTCQGVPGIPVEISRLFKGAQEIPAEAHLLMQAAVQQHVDNAVSKTINLPRTATAEDIKRYYEMAFGLGLKGLTIFRDGSKEGTITIGGTPENPEKGEKLATTTFLNRGDVLPRPKSAKGVTHRLDTGCGKLYLTINVDQVDGRIMETFITTGSDGGCLVYTNATSRLISLALRGGIPIREIIEQLQSAPPCSSYMFAKGKGKHLSDGTSCASAIAHELRKLDNGLAGKASAVPSTEKTVNNPLCDCGQLLYMAEGCLVCRSCGYSKC